MKKEEEEQGADVEDYHCTKCGGDLAVKEYYKTGKEDGKAKKLSEFT